MKTWTALTTLKGKQAADALGLTLERLIPEPTGIGVFEVEDGSGLWEVGGYFVEAPDLAGLALLAAANGAKDFVVSEIPETDWVAHVRRELAPVEAGRFFVHGGHDADKVPDDKIALLIEAAMAFGTGHHGTTQGCLLAFDKLVTRGVSPRAVADVGCGTAVLAMASAKLFPVPTIAGDIDEIAVEVAQANLGVNGMDGKVKCVTSAGFDHPEMGDSAPYDLVFANILKGPLIDLAQAMRANITVGGFLIISGILNDQADEVVSIYSDFGFNEVERLQIVDWTTTILTRKWPD